MRTPIFEQIASSKSIFTFRKRISRSVKKSNCHVTRIDVINTQGVNKTYEIMPFTLLFLCCLIQLNHPTFAMFSMIWSKQSFFAIGVGAARCRGKVVVSKFNSLCCNSSDYVESRVMSTTTRLHADATNFDYSTQEKPDINVYYDSTNNQHRDISYHPECPDRIEVCVEALNQGKKDNSFDNVRLIDVSGDYFTESELEYARSLLVKVHSEDYVSLIQEKCTQARNRRIDEQKSPLGFIGYADAGDTFMTTETYNVCLRAATSWIRAVDDSLSSRRPFAFSLTRPPGHHATKYLINGFCFFNFAAAAAKHAIELGMKVSIIDWDVHFGQGVADILKDEKNARYVSLHQAPAFPYEGERREISGTYSNILTIPIQPESTWTCGYKSLLETHAIPFLIDEHWRPDCIIICAGYDALSEDELASVNLNPNDYNGMISLIKARMSAYDIETSSIALGLEGGYQVKPFSNKGLKEAFLQTLIALSEIN